MTPPTPAPIKVKTWIFIRRARDTNDERGEGAPQQYLHGVEVRPRMPSSPVTTEVVARLSQGVHQTQKHRGLSAKLVKVVQTLQHVATHHHRGRPHHSTSRHVAPRQTHIPYRPFIDHTVHTRYHLLRLPRCTDARRNLYSLT
jgi:hypothetical protein